MRLASGKSSKPGLDPGNSPAVERMRPWYRIVWMVSRAYYSLFHNLSFHGLENVPEGSCIIAPNHVSFLDPPLVGCCVDRELHYLARKTLFKPPVMDKLLPSINSIPVD